MKKGLFSRRWSRIGLGGLLTALMACAAAGPASAATLPVIDTSWCFAPALSQSLAGFGDHNWYTMMQGESNDAFDGGGWTLTGGASIKTVTLADGFTGTVLDLPSGSKAVSPPMCIDNTYPTARTEVRNVVGAEGVQFSVANEANRTWTTPKVTGQFHGQATSWTLSGNVNLNPEHTPGWQVVRYTFVAGGKTSDFQVYNFLVDPRCRG